MERIRRPRRLSFVLLIMHVYTHAHTLSLQVLARLSALVDEGTLQTKIRCVSRAWHLCMYVYMDGCERCNQPLSAHKHINNPPPPNTYQTKNNRPCLQQLAASDPDGDVRQYALLALEGKEAPHSGPPPVDAVGISPPSTVLAQG